MSFFTHNRWWFFVNNLKEVDVHAAESEVKTNAEFSSTYVILLVVASVVTSLGLLINSSPVVIGGMIIAPLMWPLLRIAFGVVRERVSHISSGVVLLLLSIGVSILSSIIITYLSPVKVISPEILARTEPTLIDILIALAAGAVAAFGVLHHKISESLAGVALATSMMPPLCVAGIGLALFRLDIFAGGLLLFATNVISIVFISAVIFNFFSQHKTSPHESQTFKRTGLVFLASLLLLLSIPLFFFLRDYTFRTVELNQVTTILERQLDNVSPAIRISQVQTTIDSQDGQQRVTVRAELFMPEGTVVNYQQEQRLVQALQDHLQRPVELELLLTNTVSVTSEGDVFRQQQRQDMQSAIVGFVQNLDQQHQIDSLQFEYTPESNLWSISLAVSGANVQDFSVQNKQQLEDILNQIDGFEVALDVRLTPFVQLRDELDDPDETQLAFRQSVNIAILDFFDEIDTDITVAKLTLQQILPDVQDQQDEENRQYDILLELHVPTQVAIRPDIIKNLGDRLQQTTPQSSFNIQAEVFVKQVVGSE